MSRPNPKIAECSAKNFKSPTASGDFLFFFAQFEKPENNEKSGNLSDGAKKTCSYRRARAGRSGVPKKEICCVCIPPAYTSCRSHRALTYEINSCRRCHSHKIKCSGDQPCSKCCTVGLADECTYATRDRQVKVSEKYAIKPHHPIIRPSLSKSLSTTRVRPEAKIVFSNQLFRSNPRRESTAQGTVDHLGSSCRDKRCSPEVDIS